MSASLTDMIKTKIEEAQKAINNLMPNDKNSGPMKKEIEKHIEKMNDLVKEMEGKDEKTMEEFKAKVNAAVDDLGKILSK